MFLTGNWMNNAINMRKKSHIKKINVMRALLVNTNYLKFFIQCYFLNSDIFLNDYLLSWRETVLQIIK